MPRTASYAALSESPRGAFAAPYVRYVRPMPGPREDRGVLKKASWTRQLLDGSDASFFVGFISLLVLQCENEKMPGF